MLTLREIFCLKLSRWLLILFEQLLWSLILNENKQRLKFSDMTLCLMKISKSIWLKSIQTLVLNFLALYYHHLFLTWLTIVLELHLTLYSHLLMAILLQRNIKSEKYAQKTSTSSFLMSRLKENLFESS